MRRKAKSRPAKPKGKQIAGQRYHSSLLPMAISAKPKKQKQAKFKKAAHRR